METAITFVVVGLVALFLVFPSWFLHPVLRYHRHVLGHDWEIVPVGFADWNIECSCGRVAEL